MLGQSDLKSNEHSIYMPEEIKGRAKSVHRSAANEKDQRNWNRLPEVIHAKIQLKDAN